MRRKFANTEEIYDIGEQQRSLIGQVGVLEMRRSEVGADLAEAREERDQMQELATRDNVDLPSFAKLYSNESALLATKKKVIDQEGVVAQLKARFQDNSPQVVQAMTALESFRAMLAHEVDAQIKLSDRAWMCWRHGSPPTTAISWRSAPASNRCRTRKRTSAP